MTPEENERLSAASSTGDAQPDNIPVASADPERDKTTKPPYLPAKFWNEVEGVPRLEALARSYTELERKLSRQETASPAFAIPGNDAGPEELAAFRHAMGVPETADQYRIDILESYISRDPEVDAVLHRAGFSEAQAQLVYDLAAEKMVPLLARFAEEANRKAEASRLEDHFGGRERWSEIRRQMKRWAEKHLPKDVFESLSSSYDGVLALYRMMSPGNEPGLVNSGGMEGALSESQLRNMIADPRYWRDRDPVYIEKVADGFRKLYPNGRR